LASVRESSHPDVEIIADGFQRGGTSPRQAPAGDIAELPIVPELLAGH
jgi:hypothetical protein